jgi:predicted AAA+ superfamily ATPase
METNEIKRIITDQREEIEKKFKIERIVDRELKSHCEEYLKHPIALIVTGIRRCGKSVFSHLLFRDGDYCFVNFEDERMAPIKANELNKVLEAFYQLYGDSDRVILDEIQNVPGWELFVGRLQKNFKTIVTGSNARLMSRELATFLTGRHIDFILHPFSFREFLAFNGFEPNVNSTKDISKTKKFLEEYIDHGGLPEAFRFGKRFLLEVYDDVINKDILLRFRVRHVGAFKEMAKYTISNFSGEISFNRLKNTFGVKSVHTVENYVAFLESSFLVFTLNKFSEKFKEQILAPKKIYCVDSGLVNAVAFGTSENYGRLMENIVAVELKRKQAINPAVEIYYWKDHAGKEVDFVIKEGPRVKQLVQVCREIDSGTKKREVRALVKAMENFRVKEGLVITEDFESRERVGNRKIVYVPLWKWLLER